MIEPTANQTMSLSHVENSKRIIIYPQNSMPRIGITGTKGHLKARGWCGSLMRRIITAAATRQKARSVPMLTNFAISSIGKQLAVIEQQTPTMIVEIWGVPKRG